MISRERVNIAACVGALGQDPKGTVEAEEGLSQAGEGPGCVGEMALVPGYPPKREKAQAMV